LLRAAVLTAEYTGIADASSSLGMKNIFLHPERASSPLGMKAHFFTLSGVEGRRAAVSAGSAVHPVR